jgi:hypothetical protein
MTAAVYNGLGHKHQPRPWRCSRRDAFYCPLHGDCICPQLPGAGRTVHAECPLHGAGSEHAVEVTA